MNVVTVPANYGERLIPIFPGAYRRLRLSGLEAHDLALSKLERNSSRDREDVKFLARAAPLNLTILTIRSYAATLDRDVAVKMTGRGGMSRSMLDLY